MSSVMINHTLPPTKKNSASLSIELTHLAPYPLPRLAAQLPFKQQGASVSYPYTLDRPKLDPSLHTPQSFLAHPCAQPYICRYLRKHNPSPTATHAITLQHHSHEHHSTTPHLPTADSPHTYPTLPVPLVYRRTHTCMIRIAYNNENLFFFSRVAPRLYVPPPHDRRAVAKSTYPQYQTHAHSVQSAPIARQSI